MLRRELGTLGTQRKLTGDTVFKLYDTYGFPADMTADVAREEGIAVDMAGFEAHMSTQRKRSRAAMTFNIGQKTIAYDGVATEFVGYDDTETEVEVLALFVNGEAVKEARAGQEALVVLNRTPFYAQSGGQVGDIGLMCSKETKIRVTDTHKIRTDVWGHMATIDAGAVHTGMIVRGEVDATRRDAIRCNHSATHLMHAALRQVLGQHVEQKGSLVSPDYLRFDFSHHTAVSNDELRAVETIVNEQIRHNHSVETQSLPYDDALNLGAMALFGEKYGDIVRTVIIDRDFSVELCGGSHVTRTGNIGFFQFRSEGAIAAGVRRVEAVTARSAVAHAQHLHTRLQHISNLMKSSTDKVEEKIIQLRESLKETNKRLEALQAAQADQLAIQLAQLAVAHNGAQILVATDADTDIKALRELAVQLRERLSPAAVLLAGSNGDTAAFVAATDKSLNISAREWIDVVATVANAKGGGKIDFAQAGGGDCTQIDAALTAARAFVGIK
jgi:alanyl-tRNA synthetase